MHFSLALSWRTTPAPWPQQGTSRQLPHRPGGAAIASSDGVRRTQRALRERSSRPRKWLGQHYMVDEKVNERIVEEARVGPGDVVLEIGPGTGALTEVLARAGAKVVAVEKDPEMFALVSERFRDRNEQVEVVLRDVLNWPVRDYMSDKLASLSSSSKPCKLVSNLPFNITSDVVKMILPMGDLFSDLVLLLQDEAAARLVSAAPGSPQYRAMSVFVNFFSRPEYRFPVPRRSFFPEPNVDAALVAFRVKQATEYPAVASQKAFFTLVSSAFNSKRKMLRTSLTHLYSSGDVQEALQAVGMPVTARPEELGLEEFVAFFNACEAAKQRMGEELGPERCR